MRVKLFIGIIATCAFTLAGCSSTSSPSTRADAAAGYQVEDGLYVRMFADGSGSVSESTDVLSPRWSIDCAVDRMTDKRDCSIYNQIGGPFIAYNGSTSPQYVCISGHDFPGRRGLMRIDGGSPVTTDLEGCVPASRVIADLRSGTTFVGRYYEWPYDYSRDKVVSLRGLSKALEIADDLLHGRR